MRYDTWLPISLVIALRLASLLTVVLVIIAAVSPLARAQVLDRTFGVRGRVVDPPGFGFFDLVIQPNGKIVAVGSGPVARYNPDGSPDPTFGKEGMVFLADPLGKGIVSVDAAIQPDEKVVVAVRDANGSVPGWVYRLLPDGSLDASFGNDGFLELYYLPSIAASLPDGRLIVAQFSTLSRLNADGTYDSSFGPCRPAAAGVTGSSHYLYNRLQSVVQPDGKILTAFGAIVDGGSSRDFGVFRCNTNGTLDTTFGSGGVVHTPISGLPGFERGVAQSIVLQDDGNILIAGQTGLPDNIFDDGPTNLALVRYNPNGSLDASFGTAGIVTMPMELVGPNQAQASIAVQSNGKVLTSITAFKGGYPCTNYPDCYETSVLRFNSNGSVDITFGDGDGIAILEFNYGTFNAFNAMMLDNTGRALIVGQAFDLIGGSTPRSVVARLLARPRYGTGSNRSSERSGDDAIIHPNPSWSRDISSNPFPLERLF